LQASPRGVPSVETGTRLRPQLAQRTSMDGATAAAMSKSGHCRVRHERDQRPFPRPSRVGAGASGRRTADLHVMGVPEQVGGSEPVVSDMGQCPRVPVDERAL